MCTTSVEDCLREKECEESSGVSDGDEIDDFYNFPTTSFRPNYNKEQTKGELERISFLNDKSRSLTMLNTYPIIKQLFLKYNTSVCSSAPVERLFSFAGLIHAPTRGSLSDKMFEKLVFLKGNSI